MTQSKHIYDNRQKRSYEIASTIADLEGQPDIQVDHICEAFQYRDLDRDKRFI